MNCIKSYVIIMLFAATMANSEAPKHGEKAQHGEKTQEVKVNKVNYFAATENIYASQKIGVVTFRDRNIMRLVYVPKEDGTIIKRAQKIAAALNEKVFERSDAQKIGLNVTNNEYQVKVDSQWLFAYYPEDVMFNGVNEVKLLKSWITNLTRVMDIPKEDTGNAEAVEVADVEKGEKDSKHEPKKEEKKQVAPKTHAKKTITAPQTKVVIFPYIMLGITLVIGVVGGGLFYFLKRKKKKVAVKDVALIKEDVEDIKQDSVGDSKSMEISMDELMATLSQTIQDEEPVAEELVASPAAESDNLEISMDELMATLNQSVQEEPLEEQAEGSIVPETDVAKIVIADDIDPDLKEELENILNSGAEKSDKVQQITSLCIEPQEIARYMQVPLQEITSIIAQFK